MVVLNNTSQIRVNRFHNLKYKSIYSIAKAKYDLGKTEGIGGFVSVAKL